MSSLDISCASYNNNYNNAINQIAQNSAANRTWTRVEGFNNNPLIAVDASCGSISKNVQQRMLNKKIYMLSNNRNNVQSGTKNNVLTKAQIYSRVARGYTPQGRIAPGYGIQTATLTNPNPFNIPRFNNRLVTSCCAPTGGTITQVEKYKLHTFTSDGVFLLSGLNCPSLICDIVLVGGGGGGGSTKNFNNAGGGGGGGEVKIMTNYTLLPGSYNITIGSGGSHGGDGGKTIMSSVADVSGGKQGGRDISGDEYTGTRGGTSGSGQLGGLPISDITASMAGGGGGDGGAGGDASYNFAIDPSYATGGNGGKGTKLDATWTGEIIYLGYGGGGGGGSIVPALPDGRDPSGGFGGWYENDPSISAGTSGNGGQGNQYGLDATYSYGGGGGGGSNATDKVHKFKNGGHGGNGVVFIRYQG